MQNKYPTELAHRLPPLKSFTFQSLLDICKRCGAYVEIRYHPRQREFLVFTRNKHAQVNLQKFLRAFPEQAIRL